MRSADARGMLGPALSTPALLPALASTPSVKPSKGASFSAAFNTACLKFSSEADLSDLGAAFFLLTAGLSVMSLGRGEVTNFGFEDQLGKIVHAGGVEPAVEVIHLMLHNPGVEAARDALDGLAVCP